MTITPHLRIEAGPARWEELDQAQCKAYLHLGRMIVEAIEEVPPLDSDSGVREGPDRNVGESVRRTRTAFLAGGRGTGKTTLMTSLMRDSQSEGRKRDPGPTEVRELRVTIDDLLGRVAAQQIADAVQSVVRQEVSHREPTDEVKKLFEQRSWRDDLIRKMRGRIVWLETLHMEPLPKDANLLAAILMRLEDAANVYGASPSANSPRGLLEPSSEYQAALLELQRLQTDVALAWDGNLGDRQGQLDPDAYAVEVMRTEKARLSINTKFTKTLNQLARYVFRREVDDPLFILPVDDFDLSPATCLDLLRVLRLISAPRFFTIVIGDLRVASTVLALKFSNDLGSIVDSGLKEAMLALEPATVGALAGDVAANALRKLLPPGQRVELSPMRLSEALNFKPLGAEEGHPRLHRLLGSCPVFVNIDLAKVSDSELTQLEKHSGDPQGQPRVASLRQLLLTPGIVLFDDARPVRHSGRAEKTNKPLEIQDKLEEALAENVVYSGTSFISAPPRHVADTWLELYKITGYGKRPAAAEGRGQRRAVERENEEVTELLVSHFAKVAQAALRETPDFNPDERADVERAIGRTIADTWTLRALPITVLSETTRSAAVELPFRSSTSRTKQAPTSRRSRAATSSSPRASFVTAEGLGWQMRISKTERTRRPDSLRNRDSWYGPGRLLSDSAVAALIVYHDLLTFAYREPTFVTPLLTQSNLRVDWAVTQWREHEVSFPWPIPPARTFLDLDRFKNAWNYAIKSSYVTDSSLEQHAERLLFAWLVAGTVVVMHQSPVQLPKSDAEVPWGDLVKQLDQAANCSTRDCREWLLRVLELLMPEMGMQQGWCAAFRKDSDTFKFWERDCRIRVQQRRAERLAELSKVDTELAERLRASSEGFACDFAPDEERVRSLSRQGSSDWGA
jgi:hypothetical protein